MVGSTLQQQRVLVGVVGRVYSRQEVVLLL